MTSRDHSFVSEELEERIRSLHRMSPSDWQAVLAMLTDRSRARAEFPPSLLAALTVRINYDLVNALHKMDASSEGLARKLIVLTRVLVILTAVLLIEPANDFIHWLWKSTHP